MKCVKFTLKACPLRGSTLPHFALLALEGCFDRARYLGRDRHVLEHAPQSLYNFFLSETRQFTRTTSTAAPVIDVLVLLYLAGHGAIVVGAGKQPSKRYVVLPVLWSVM